jgi:hypothetical protein
MISAALLLLVTASSVAGSPLRKQVLDVQVCLISLTLFMSSNSSALFDRVIVVGGARSLRVLCPPLLGGFLVIQ